MLSRKSDMEALIDGLGLQKLVKGQLAKVEKPQEARSLGGDVYTTQELFAARKILKVFMKLIEAKRKRERIQKKIQSLRNGRISGDKLFSRLGKAFLPPILSRSLSGNLSRVAVALPPSSEPDIEMKQIPSQLQLNPQLEITTSVNYAAIKEESQENEVPANDDFAEESDIDENSVFESKMPSTTDLFSNKIKAFPRFSKNLLPPLDISSKNQEESENSKLTRTIRVKPSNSKVSTPFKTSSEPVNISTLGQSPWQSRQSGN